MQNICKCYRISIIIYAFKNYCAKLQKKIGYNNKNNIFFQSLNPSILNESVFPSSSTTVTEWMPTDGFTDNL